MSITIDPITEAKLRERAAREGQDINILADILLDMALEWELRDRAEAVDGIKRGLLAFDEGRSQPFREFAVEQRAKFRLPSHAPDPQ